ncbi:MAG: helicase-exonuclease AddAB subunit AddA [Epulopiscium sp.]|nr:helicase-exonuclease AddAB subunit AddA [Candidatus Epulonipiscium sp.]
MSMSWTKEQLSAIETHGCNLLVSAAAGSGKTAVLVERIIQKVTDPKKPVDIDRLLIVTFTNAAAAEMRERIGNALMKKIEERPGDVHLQKQLTLIHRASIMTIHAFCLEVIRSYFHMIDLDPHFRIGNETEIKLLKSDVLETLLEDWYQKEENTSFLALVESYGGKKQDTPLEDIILNLYHFIQSYPWPDLWLAEKIEEFNLSNDHTLQDTVWAEPIKEQLAIECKSYLKNIMQALTICREEGGPLGYEEALLSDQGMIQDFLQAVEEGFYQTWDAFQKIEFVRLGRCGKDTDKEAQEEVKQIRDEVKSGIDSLREKVFYKSIEEIEIDIKKLYPLLQGLQEVILDFTERFQEEKREKNILDFNDIEHYALKILVQLQDGEVAPTFAAKELQGKYEEILIDEYQDSNLVQETILRSISKIHQGQPNTFMVGDVKQSIYRFRLAKPELFMEKYQDYSKIHQGKEKEKGQKEGQRIDLARNFRSRTEVLSGINFIFRQLMSQFLGEIVYDADAALYPGADFPEPPEGVEAGGNIEIHLMEQKGSADFGEEFLGDEEERVELEQLSQIELEGRMVAQRIKDLVHADPPQQIWDGKQKVYRTIEYRDIVILLRATHRWASIFQEELTRYHIPVYTDVAVGYFSTTEVKTILNLLHIIDNPRQDIPLIAVLRSPIVNVNANELVEIRTTFAEGDLYDALQVYQKGEGQESILKEKVRGFLQKLDRWREWAAYMPIDELLWALYLDTHYYYYVGAMPGGAQRQANLRVLLDRAAEYEEGSYTGLFQFIRFIEKIQRNQGDLGSPQILGENENLVKIMSIHKSKGLEFPVVFVSGLGKGFNLLDLRQPILLHQELGLGPSYVDFERRISYNTFPRSAIYQKILRENLSEEMRVLYVALTRAKEKLILTGSVKEIEKTATKWCRALNEAEEGINPYILLKSRNYLDWIGFALVRHPDGQIIRQWGQRTTKEKLYHDESKWEIYQWSPEQLYQEEDRQEEFFVQIKEELKNWDPNKVYSSQRKEIEKRLMWEYPYEGAVSLPVKISVSEIKRRFQEEQMDSGIEEMNPIEGSSSVESDEIMERILPLPQFIEEKRMKTGAEKGIVFHFVLQHIDFKDMADTDSIINALDHLVDRGLLTEEEREGISIPSLITFGRSTLVQRMKEAKMVKKEMPFVMGRPAKSLYPDLEELPEVQEEIILVQGMIDCYFEEEDGLVLVDYKTDYVPNGQVDIIKERYRTQIELYTQALEQIIGKKVKEKILYLFSIHEMVRYE